MSRSNATPGAASPGSSRRTEISVSQQANGIDFTLLYSRDIPWGTLTSTTQATYLYNFEFPQGETAVGLGLGGDNLVGFTTNPGASNEGFYKWKAQTTLDWAWRGFDVLGTVRYIDSFDELDPTLVPRTVEYTIRIDLQASYDFTSLIPVESNPVPGYAKDAKSGSSVEAAEPSVANNSISARLLRGTVLTIGSTTCSTTTRRLPPVKGATRSATPASPTMPQDVSSTSG